MMFSRFFSVIHRFPAEFMTGISFAFLGIFIQEIHFQHEMILFSFPLLFVFFLCGSVLFENLQRKFSLFHGIWIMLSLVFFSLSVSNFWSWDGHYHILLQHFLWIFSLLLFAVILGFSEKKENTFLLWKAAEKTIEAVFIALFFGGIAFASSMLFFSALDMLFGITISNNLPPDLFFLSSGIVSVLAFLSFFPKKNDLREEDFSAFSRIAGLFLFLPISTGYVLLLYGYSAKILLAMEIPNGFLAGITAGFSAVVIFTIFQIFPLQNEKPWIQKISRLAALLLVPQASIMLWSMFIRIEAYGITESRYFLVMFGIFVLFTALFWGISKKISFRIPFMFFAFLLTISSFGPWGAHYISLKSQENRLVTILQQYELVQNETIVFPNQKPNYSKEEEQEISSIISYFFQTASKNDLKEILHVPDEILNATTKNVSGNEEFPLSIWEMEEQYRKKLFVENIYSYNQSIPDTERNMKRYFYDGNAQKASWTTKVPKNFENVAFINENFYTPSNAYEYFLWKDGKIFLLLENETIDMTSYVEENFFEQNTNEKPDFVFENEKISLRFHIKYLEIVDYAKNPELNSFSMQGILWYQKK